MLSELTFFPVKFEEDFTRAVSLVSNPAEDPLIPVTHLAVWRRRDVDAGHVSVTLNTVEHVLNMSDVCVTQPPCPPHGEDRGKEEEVDDADGYHPHFPILLSSYNWELSITKKTVHKEE